MAGLDPRTNRIEREAEKAAAAVPARLEPPFPFRPIAFDPAFFGVDEDPPKPLPLTGRGGG
jgi:hypothetical protein